MGLCVEGAAYPTTSEPPTRRDPFLSSSRCLDGPGSRTLSSPRSLNTPCRPFKGRILPAHLALLLFPPQEEEAVGVLCCSNSRQAHTKEGKPTNNIIVFPQAQAQVSLTEAGSGGS